MREVVAQTTQLTVDNLDSTKGYVMDGRKGKFIIARDTDGKFIWVRLKALTIVLSLLPSILHTSCSVIFKPPFYYYIKKVPTKCWNFAQIIFYFVPTYNLVFLHEHLQYQ